MAGKVQTAKADQLRAKAEENEPDLRKAIKEAVAQIKDTMVLAGVTRALNEDDAEAALEATGIDKLKEELSGPLTAGVIAALLTGAGLGREELPSGIARTAPAFDLQDAATQRWIRQNGARQVTQISGGSRRAIQSIIADQLASGEGARAAARRIRDVIGLTNPQQAALQRLREAMSEAGATKAVVDRTMAARAERMLDERAFAIARNESFTAVAQGRQMYWEQLVANGELDPATLRKWITAEDEFVCPICRPMHNQIRGLNEPFDKGTGGTTLTTPAHVTCRCSVILVAPGRPPEE